MLTVTNVGHSGFTVESSSFMLIFDYSEGTLPPLPENKKLFVFISHRHPDHFNPDIFSLCAAHNEVHYFISDDIYEYRIREHLKDDYTMVHPGDDIYLTTRFRIKVLPSTDCGVAFLVCDNGRNIFHAGDLNLWLWEGMSEADTYAMTKRFEECTAGLRNFVIDTAFLPLDTRQGIYAPLGFDYYMKHFKILHAIPMHFFGSPRISRDLIENPISLKYRKKIIPLDPGCTTEIK